MPAYPHDPRLAGPPRGRLAQLVAGLVSALALVVAAVLGAFVFLAALGVVLITAVAVMVRVAWLRRRLRAAGQGSSPKATDPRSGTIDGEYRVIHSPAARADRQQR